MTATNGGVFAVARSIWSHTELKPAHEPYTRLEAWLWLLSQAKWRAHDGLERGEFSFSIRFLERKWKWKPGRVERFINTLKSRDTIRDTTRDRGRTPRRDTPAVHIINNYNGYQTVGLPSATRQTTKTRQGSRFNRDKEETLELPSSKEEGRASLASPVKGSNSRANLKVIDGGEKPDPWKEVFDFGKSVLRPSAGGQIAKLKKLYIDAPYLAMAKLHEAKTKTKPAAWLGAFLFNCHDPEGRLDGDFIDTAS